MKKEYNIKTDLQAMIVGNRVREQSLIKGAVEQLMDLTMNDPKMQEIMEQFCLREVSESGLVPPEFNLTVASCTAESMEDTPIFNAYWAATTKFFRKVYQTGASSL